MRAACLSPTGRAACGSILRRAACLDGRTGRDSPHVCGGLPELERCPRICQGRREENRRAALMPLPEEGAGSTAIERARSTISAMPDRW
jgi:hypothetical protein